MSDKLVKKHPDTATSIAAIQSAYEEVYTVIQMFYSEAGDNTALTDYIRDIDSNLANIWREAQAALARSDRMYTTVTDKNDTIADLVREVDVLRKQVNNLQTRGDKNAARRAKEAFNNGRIEQVIRQAFAGRK